MPGEARTGTLAPSTTASAIVSERTRPACMAATRRPAPASAAADDRAGRHQRQRPLQEPQDRADRRARIRIGPLRPRPRERPASACGVLQLPERGERINRDRRAGGGERLDHQRGRVRVGGLEAPRISPAVPLPVADRVEEREWIASRTRRLPPRRRLDHVRRRVRVGLEEVLRRTHGRQAVLVVVRRGRLAVLPAAVGALRVHQPLDRVVGHRCSRGVEGQHRERIIEDRRPCRTGRVAPSVPTIACDQVHAAERSCGSPPAGDDRGHDLRLRSRRYRLSVRDPSPEEPERIVSAVPRQPRRRRTRGRRRRSSRSGRTRGWNRWVVAALPGTRSRDRCGRRHPAVPRARSGPIRRAMR